MTARLKDKVGRCEEKAVKRPPVDRMLRDCFNRNGIKEMKDKIMVDKIKEAFPVILSFMILSIPLFS